MKKTIALILCVITLVGVLQLPMLAANEGIMLLNNNTASTTTVFAIDSNGTAYIEVTYSGYSGITTGGTITTKMQRRTLGIFWDTVYEWTDTSSEVDFSMTHIYHLTKTGEYRIVVEYVISGTGGADDVIEQTRQASW